MLYFTERSQVIEKHVQNITLNFGPQHPAAHGVLRLVLTLDGEVGTALSLFLTNRLAKGEIEITLQLLQCIILEVLI